jgi:hypothetical protein
MDFNIELTKILHKWFYHVIIKIILSYRALNYMKLLHSYCEKTGYDNIIFDNNKLYFNSNSGAYFDLELKKFLFDSDEKKTN